MSRTTRRRRPRRPTSDRTARRRAGVVGLACSLFLGLAPPATSAEATTQSSSSSPSWSLTGNVASPDDPPFPLGSGPDHPTGCDPAATSQVGFSKTHQFSTGDLAGRTITWTGTMHVGVQDRSTETHGDTIYGFPASYGALTNVTGTFRINSTPEITGTIEGLASPLSSVGRNVASCYGVGSGDHLGYTNIASGQLIAIDANLRYVANRAGAEPITGQVLFRQRQTCVVQQGRSSGGCGYTGPSLSFHGPAQPVPPPPPPTLPAISIPDVTFDEVAAASDPDGFSTIRMTLDAPALAGTFVRITAVDETATHGVDYELIGGVTHRRFAPQGSRSFPVTMRILDDGVFDGTETFRLELSDPENATIARGVAVVTIVDPSTPPPPDADGDGVADAVDSCPGTPNADQADLDGDGIGDACDDDMDGDGLANALEVELGCDPRAVDTDGDGLEDGAEVELHDTSPTSSDTDGDGTSDGDEVLVHGTSPTTADTDADGLADGAELERGTDPLRSDSDGDGFGDAIDAAPLATLAGCEPTLPRGPVSVGTPVTACLSLGGPGLVEGGIDWGDGATRNAGAAGDLVAEHVYAKAGVYLVRCHVEDTTGGRQTVVHRLVVVDPNGGFVSGGGWLDVPVNAAPGKAGGPVRVGFNAKYSPGAAVPKGELQVQFQAADVTVHGHELEWLVVDGDQARWTGTATVNGQPGHAFSAWMVDGDVTGAKKADAFRVRVWRVADGITILDTAPGLPDDARAPLVRHGSMVIHRAKR